MSGTDQPRLRYLRDICSLLWPPPATVDMVGGASSVPTEGTPHGHQVSSEFLLVPGSRKPRLLVPAHRRAAAGAVRHYGEQATPAARARAKVLSSVLASGLGRVVTRNRVRVRGGTDTIESHLRHTLGKDVLVSLHVGPPRANRKPVLQLLDRAGNPLAFAKVGINPLTSKLVRAEHAALAQLAGAGLRGVTVPTVLHRGTWHDLDVLVLAALPVWQPRRETDGDKLAAAMREVALMGGTHRAPLHASAYWWDLRARLEATGHGDDRSALLVALDTIAARAGHTPVELGSWHGDWTPWNMANVDRTLLVWDWERFTGGVPLGFDALHYHLQATVVRDRVEPRAAAASCVERATRLLAPFEVHAPRLTAVLYLVDLATRYLEDRQDQAGARLGVPGSWLTPAVTEQAPRL